jgi:hypothetical protein
MYGLENSSYCTSLMELTTHLMRRKVTSLSTEGGMVDGPFTQLGFSRTVRRNCYAWN